MIYKYPTQVKDAEIKVGDTLWGIDLRRLDDIDEPIQLQVVEYYTSDLVNNAFATLMDTSLEVQTYSEKHKCSIWFTFFNNSEVILADTEEECLSEMKRRLLEELNSCYREKEEAENKLDAIKQKFKDISRIMVNNYELCGLYSEYFTYGYDKCKSKIDSGEL